MDCEIVKSIALDKEFFYCRTHKKEAPEGNWLSCEVKESSVGPEDVLKWFGRGAPTVWFPPVAKREEPTKEQLELFPDFEWPDTLTQEQINNIVNRES